jgi:ABC-type transport system substrate-binding protein
MALLAGCSLPFPFPQPTPDAKLPDSQQNLHISMQSIATDGDDIEAPDPAFLGSTQARQIAQLIFPQLVTLDEQDAPVDWTAERHEVSADGLAYTFHLRKGIVWSDGTPIDAGTFAYSINRALDPCTESQTASYLWPIKGAKAFNTAVCPAGALTSASTLIGSSLIVPDPLTLQIRLDQPTGYFLSALTTPVTWGAPQTLVERFGATTRTTTWTEHLADNGGFGGNLYRLTKWDHAGHLELARNERFWGKKPALRRIEYSFYNFRAADAAWADFKQGQGDIAIPPTTDSGYLADAHEVAVARTLKGVTVQEAPTLSMSFLRVGWRNAPFDDVRVRQAFALAIDRQAIAHDLSQDTVQPTIHLLPVGAPGYNSALADAAGRVGEAALTPDLETARRLASAYAAEKCQGSYALCPAVRYLTGGSIEGIQGTTGKRIQMVRDQLQRAFPGWNIFFDSFFCHIKGCAREAQLADFGWIADYPDPQDFLSLLWTTHAEYNWSFVGVPAADAFCAQADAMQDQATRSRLYRQAEQMLVTQVAAIPLYQSIDTYAVRSHVVGWHIGPMGITPLSVWQQVYIRR